MEPLNCQEIKYETIDISEQTGISGASSIKLNLPPINDSEFPTVSVVVPTYNRQQFYSLIIRNWERIDYPRDKLELIILDDSDNISQNVQPPDFFKAPGIRYIRHSTKMTIGEKRNMLADLAKHKYIVHMDDDDWYPPESVAARIRCLLEFEKAIKQPGCVGCTRVLCLDLITNQMFEAFDQSIAPPAAATLSESTMAYSKAYWDVDQGGKSWNPTSVFAECLPFLSGRHQTVCDIPSVFVVTQLSHGANTVERHVEKSSVSEFNAIRFQSSLSAYDSQVFNKIRANVVKKIPGFREALGFIQKCQTLNKKQLQKMISRTKDTRLLENPLVIEFMREALITKMTSSGKDIVYYCGPGAHLKFNNPWNPESKTIGGSEEAVINLSNYLANLGYRITVYCVLEGNSKNYNGVYYKPYWEWIPKNVQDVTIIWRDPSNCKYAVGSSKKVLLDVHDALNPIWLEGLHKEVKIMTKSYYHRQILKTPNAYVIPNGIKPINLFVPRKPHLMVCTSSPDRCVRALLRAMPLIREVVPDAEIHWAYGFKAGVTKGGMEEHHNPEVREWVKETKELIKNTPGFKDLGRLSQDDVNKLYARADLFVYPTIFPEIDCISLSKAMSAGAIPIVTPCGAMAEKMNIKAQMATNEHRLDSSFPDGEQFKYFVNAVIEQLQNVNKDEQRNLVKQTADLKYSWSTIVEKWTEVMGLVDQKVENFNFKRRRI